MRRLCSVVFVACFCLCVATFTWGQAQITTGTIQGDVVDEKGGTVPEANVELRNLDTNLVKTQVTGQDGRFTFLLMPPGRYTLTASKQGFATLVQEEINLTVGQTLSLPMTMKVSAVEARIVVTATPTVDIVKTENSTTLNQLTVGNTPILGRKFEDLLTLTPGVSIVQGPDGDEITFNGQRGIFNNISLDGGDYNNGFFGEQLGGQRAAIDITLDAVKEFQVVAAGANAEFGRTAGGVVNVITKSGTNDLHGTAFYFQRARGLSSNTSTGEPLTGFHREQVGGTIGGPIIKDKMFFFAAVEGIRENLQRANLSAPLGAACSVAAPVVGTDDAVIDGSAECQRVALLNFFKTSVNQDEGLPVNHPIRNVAALGRFDWNLTAAHQLSASFNFDHSRNENQTFDVATYGNSANGTEGPSRIQAYNVNLVSTISANKLNEAHFSYSRENRPRSATPSNVPADTAMGFGTTFRFGNPFFLQPNVDELLWRTQVRDNFSIIHGKHTFKFGGEWLHTNNAQVFRGFFTGRYIFDTVVGFLHYASPASMGPGFGPTTITCSDGTFTDISIGCGEATATGGPLIFYLQDGVPTGLINIAPGASDIVNEDFALFAQDKWQILPNLSLSYGFRWEAQIFPDLVVPPSDTAYAKFLSDPRFPTDGTLPSPKKMFQPRVGFAWDIRSNQKSVLRASWGIYNAHQNMLTQVGSITTNGVQQRTIFTESAFGGGPVWPNAFPVTPSNVPCTDSSGAVLNDFPCFTGVRAFSKNYKNPRIYTTNVAYEQEIYPNWVAYADFTWSKGVHLTTFYNASLGFFDDSGTFVPAGAFGPELGDVFITASTAKSLYRGLTIGMRKRFSRHFQLEWNYVLSEDLDNDSNERDPFTDRRLDVMNPARNYGFSDRDERHKFNLFSYAEIPGGFNVDLRLQAHSPQPITPATCTDGCKRNSTWKNNDFITFDWRVSRPFKFGDRFQLIPTIEMFNTFNNDNNVNPLTTPGLFNFDGFLRQGVGDPRQAQVAVKFVF